jgi:predicted adenylyl cyclase CyaB
MLRNIEIKACLLDWDSAHRAASKLADGPPEILDQEDVFFAVPTGRLKLRTINAGTDRARSELIHYHRPDQPGPKQSAYSLLPISDPLVTRQIFESLHGLRGVVRKNRWLYMHGQTRIHLDRVESLGDYLELEVVLAKNQSAADGQHIALDLAAQLGVRQEHLIDCAYIDLLESNA